MLAFQLSVSFVVGSDSDRRSSYAYTVHAAVGFKKKNWKLGEYEIDIKKITVSFAPEVATAYRPAGIESIIFFTPRNI